MSTTEPTRILLLDDSRAVLDQVSSELREHGFAVSTTDTLNEAWAKVGDVDIVLIDYYMPEINGARALESLRARAGLLGRVTLFYIYTADREVAHRFKELGFDGAFTEKGSSGALAPQVAAAARMLRLRRFRQRRGAT